MSEISKCDYVWLDGRLNYQHLDVDVKKARIVGYYQNGNISFEYFSCNDKMDGLCRAWYEDGSVRIEEIFSNGKLLLSKEWFPGGQIKTETPYKNGRIHGVSKSWYENGKLCKQSEYIEHMFHGVTTHWYSSGRLKSQERFESGLPHGINVYWDESGRLLGKKVFIRGIMITNRIHNLVNSGELNAQHILKIKNTAVRRICLEELGYAKFLAQLEHEVVDQKGEYVLVKINWHKREEPVCLVKVRCPSTDAFYVLRVPPSMKTVSKALAWTFGMKDKEYLPKQET